MDYIVAAANLYGQIFGINGSRDPATIRQILEYVPVPLFTPKSSVKVHLTDEEMKEDEEKNCSDAGELFPLCVMISLLNSIAFLNSLFFVYAPEKAQLEDLKRKLASPALKSSALQMFPMEFEKVGQKCSNTSSAHSAEPQTDWRLSVHGELHSDVKVLS